MLEQISTRGPERESPQAYYQSDDRYPPDALAVKPSRSATLSQRMDDRFGHDPEGGDLVVEPYHKRLAAAIDWAAELKLAENDPSADQLDINFKGELIKFFNRLDVELKSNHELLEARLEELSDEDRAIATALQDWVLQNLKMRAENRGHDHDPTSEDTYLETIDVLKDFEDKLEFDELESGVLAVYDNKQHLLKLSEAWRYEAGAELGIETVLMELSKLAPQATSGR